MLAINKHIVHTTNTILSPIHTSKDTSNMSDTPKIVTQDETQTQTERPSSSPSPSPTQS